MTDYIKKYFLREKILFALSVSSKIFLGLLITKIISINFGIEKAGTISNFFILTSVIYLVSHGGLGLFISECISSYKDTKIDQNKVLSLSLYYIIAIFLIILLMVFFYIDNINLYVFNNTKESLFLIILALSSFFPIAINGIITSVFNGLKKSSLTALSTLFASLISIFFSILIFYFYREYTIYCLVINFYFQLIFTFYFFRKVKFSFEFMIPSKKVYMTFYKFLFYTILSSVLIPFFSLFIRNIIFENYGQNFLSIWFANNRLSDSYMLFLTTILLAIYFPKFVNLNFLMFLSETKKIIFFIFTFFVFLFLFFYFFKSDLIILIFGNDFLFASNYINYQLISDLLKILSYIPTIFLLSKKQFLIVCLFEVFQFLILVVVYYFLTPTNFSDFYLINIISYAFYSFSTFSYIYFYLLYKVRI